MRGKEEGRRRYGNERENRGIGERMLNDKARGIGKKVWQQEGEKGKCVRETQVCGREWKKRVTEGNRIRER